MAQLPLQKSSHCRVQEHSDLIQTFKQHVRGAETAALRKGQEAELGIAELKVLGFWFGSGASTSEGQQMLDVLEMKPGRLTLEDKI